MRFIYKIFLLAAVIFLCLPPLTYAQEVNKGKAVEAFNKNENPKKYSNDQEADHADRLYEENYEIKDNEFSKLEEADLFIETIRLMKKELEIEIESMIERKRNGRDYDPRELDFFICYYDCITLYQKELAQYREDLSILPLLYEEDQFEDHIIDPEELLMKLL